MVENDLHFNKGRAKGTYFILLSRQSVDWCIKTNFLTPIFAFEAILLQRICILLVRKNYIRPYLPQSVLSLSSVPDKKVEKRLIACNDLGKYRIYLWR